MGISKQSQASLDQLASQAGLTTDQYINQLTNNDQTVHTPKFIAFKLHHASDDIAVNSEYTPHRVLGFGNIKRITGPKTDLKVKRNWVTGEVEEVKGLENGVKVIYTWHYNFLNVLKEITRQEL